MNFIQVILLLASIGVMALMTLATNNAICYDDGTGVNKCVKKNVQSGAFLKDTTTNIEKKEKVIFQAVLKGQVLDKKIASTKDERALFGDNDNDGVIDNIPLKIVVLRCKSDTECENTKDTCIIKCTGDANCENQCTNTYNHCKSCDDAETTVACEYSTTQASGESVVEDKERFQEFPAGSTIKISKGEV